MATGVLVLGLGRATRLLGHLTLTDKAYDATIRLGATTVTDDAEGEVVGPADRRRRRGRRPRCAGRLRRRDRAGPVGGLGDQGRRRRAYERVRAGEEVELEAAAGHRPRVEVTGVRPCRRGSTSTFACSARAGPTCARSPATSGAELGSGVTSRAAPHARSGHTSSTGAHTWMSSRRTRACAHRRRRPGGVPVLRPGRGADHRRAVRRQLTLDLEQRPGGAVRARRGVPGALRAGRRARPGGRGLRLNARR